MKTKEIVKGLDKGLRHRSGISDQARVEAYCKVFRVHAYATNDDSWNELEKLITHVLGMNLYYKRFMEIIGMKTLDPRDVVWDFEDRQEDQREAKSRAIYKFLGEQGILPASESMDDTG